MKWSILSVALLILLEVIVVSVAVSPEYIAEQRRLEANRLTSVLGNSASRHIELMAHRNYRRFIVESGFKARLVDMVTTSRHERERSVGIEDLDGFFKNSVESRLGAVFETLKSVFLRLELMFTILPFVLPLMVAFTIDGWMSRSIMKAGFESANPVLYHFSKNVLVVLIFTPIIIALFPASVAVYLSFLWAFAFPFFIWQVTSNVQHFSA